jgi:hypothetical protein
MLSLASMQGMYGCFDFDFRAEWPMPNRRVIRADIVLGRRQYISKFPKNWSQKR